MRSFCSLPVFLSLTILLSLYVVKISKQQLSMILNGKLKKSRLLTLFAFVLISTSVYSQTQKDVKEQNKDSLCLDSLKSYSDTTSLRTNHSNQLLLLRKAKSNNRLSKGFNLPKYNPYKKKFSDLQILKTIGSHIKK